MMRILPLLVLFPLLVGSSKGFQTDRMKVGEKDGTDIIIEFDESYSDDDPQIKWDSTNSQIVISNDGTTFVPIGAAPIKLEWNQWPGSGAPFGVSAFFNQDGYKFNDDSLNGNSITTSFVVPDNYAGTNDLKVKILWAYDTGTATDEYAYTLRVRNYSPSLANDGETTYTSPDNVLPTSGTAGLVTELSICTGSPCQVGGVNVVAGRVLAIQLKRVAIAGGVETTANLWMVAKNSEVIIE